MPNLEIPGSIARVQKAFLEKVQDNLIWKHVIDSHAVQALEFRGRQIVSELFNAFMADPKSLLDETSRRRLDKGPPSRVVIMLPV